MGKMSKVVNSSLLNNLDENMRNIEKDITSKVTCADDKGQEKSKLKSELPVALLPKEAAFKMPDISSLKISDHKSEVPTKRRNTKRKPRQFNTSTDTKSKGKYKEAIENTTAVDDAVPKNQSPLLFSLVPSKAKNGKILPQLDRPYMRIKDYSASVSTFQKFLKAKLNLDNESEIEIFCRGKKLHPTMNLNGIKMIWLEGLTRNGFLGKTKKWTVEEITIELAYSMKS